MTRSMETFLKGMGMGVTFGCVVGIMGTCMMKKRKKGLKATASRALHSMGDLLENML